MSKKTFCKMMVFAVIIVFLGAPMVSFSTVSASDIGMHITSPNEGATITTATFQVSGTFDVAQTRNFNLT